MGLAIFDEMSRGLLNGMKDDAEQAIFCTVSERDGERVLVMKLWKGRTLNCTFCRFSGHLLAVRELRGPMLDKTLARLERDDDESILTRGRTVQCWLECAWRHQDAVEVEG